MSTVVLLEGLRRVDPSEPVLRADDLGVLRGESVFETLRIAGGRPCFLDEHLARLQRSAQRLDMLLPTGWEELAKTATDGVDDGVLRLVCTKGGVGYALVTPVPAEAVAARQGVSAVTLTLGVSAEQRGQAPWLLGGVKSTSYAVNMASIRAAHDAGADEAIWLSSDGWLLEAPTATVMVRVDGEWRTPPVETGILPGTTLGAVRTLVTVITAPISAPDLAEAEEVALLSSVRGVAPVRELDGRAKQIALGRDLSDAFEASLRG